MLNVFKVFKTKRISKLPLLNPWYALVRVHIWVGLRNVSFDIALIPNFKHIQHSYLYVIVFTLKMFSSTGLITWIFKISLFKEALSGLKQFLATESLFRIIKNAFYFTLKTYFVLKIFKFLSWLFGHIEKRLN